MQQLPSTMYASQLTPDSCADDLISHWTYKSVKQFIPYTPVRSLCFHSAAKLSFALITPQNGFSAGGADFQSDQLRE